jgi:hypothetical protein
MRILFCGASGYGNVGDDLYKVVLSEHLEGYECLFDSPYPDKRAVAVSDIVVIGPGGLLYKNKSPHFDYLKVYMDECLNQGKPLVFLGCGLQFDASIDYNDDEAVRMVMRPWKPYVEAAELVTVRSQACSDRVSIFAPKSSPEYYPDLGYLLTKSDYDIYPDTGYILIIPRVNSLEDPNWAKMIESSLGQHVVVATFAAEDIDISYEVRTAFDKRQNIIDRKYLLPGEAASLVSGAGMVKTQRYHGMVLANKYKIPYELYHFSYKMVSEVAPQDPNDAMKHISRLKELFPK